MSNIYTLYKMHPSGSSVKNLPAMQEVQDTRVRSPGREDALEAWQPTPMLLPGESHGQRSRWAAAHGVTKRWT